MEIIDAHVHVGSNFSSCYFTDHHFAIDELLEEMESNNVNNSVIMGGGISSKIYESNKDVLNAIKLYPNKFIGFVRINPYLKDALDEIDKYINEFNFKGIKLHPAQDFFDLSIAQVEKIMDRAKYYKVPVIIHSGTIPYSMPSQIAELAIKHPNVKIIMGHAGKQELYYHLESSVKRAENIFLELSMSGPFFVPQYMNSFGTERVIYGSNWPTGSMKPWIKTVENMSNLSSKQVEAFLSKNILNVLN